MLHVGQTVECIDDSPGYMSGTPTALKLGNLYKIRELVPGRGMLGRQETFVHVDDSLEIYSQRRFRPLSDSQKLKDLLSVPADPDSEKWDNRKKVPERVQEPHHALSPLWGTSIAPTVQTVSWGSLSWPWTWLKSD
jgi:hypothetical protein